MKRPIEFVLSPSILLRVFLVAAAFASPTSGEAAATSASRSVAIFNDSTPVNATSRVTSVFNDKTPANVSSRIVSAYNYGPAGPSTASSRIVSVFNESAVGRIAAVSRIVQVAFGSPARACLNILAVPPSETFLRTSQDTEGNGCLRVDLEQIGAQEGEMLLLSRQGAFAQPGYATPVTYTTNLYAATVDIVDGWDFEGDATGAPDACDAQHTALQRYGYPVNDSWLEASDFDVFTLPPDRRIIRVELDVMAGHDPTNGGSFSASGAASKLQCDLRLSGVTVASMPTGTWNDASLSCSWRLSDALGGNGWDVTSLVMNGGTITEAAVNSIGMRVRRCPSCGDRWIRVNSFRLTVTTEPTGGAACPTLQSGSGMIAVFSSSNTLLPADNAARVPGAIGVGAGYLTSPTFFGQLPTDIPQDFLVTDSTVVRIPMGARSLFVAAHDSFYSDNCDPDHDFAISIKRAGGSCPGVSAVSEPQDPAGGGLRVSAPFPNPTRGPTSVVLRVEQETTVDLQIFDVAGRRVRTARTGILGPGTVTLDWDGRDDFGSRARNGVYFLRLRAGSATVTRRIVVY